MDIPRTFSKLLLYFFLLLLSQAALAGARTALIIGNSNYAESPLSDSASNATDVASALTRLGFEVRVEQDADRKTMRRAIREFGGNLGSDDVGLFYFSGHSIQVNDKNYLIPINANFIHEYEVRDQTISANMVLRTIERAGNSLNVVILDASRRNSFVSQFRSNRLGLARMDAPTGSIVAHSTTPGTLSSAGDGRNSLYTKHLVTAIQTPDTDIESVFKKVRTKVAGESAGTQIPWEESSLLGEFFFAKSDKPVQPEPDTSEEPVKVTMSIDAAELTIWQGISESQNAADFKQYLADFPNGYFVQQAKTKLDQLAIDEAAVTERLQTVLLTPTPAQTQEVGRLLLRADSAFNSYYLTTPKGNNAYEFYQAVLDIDPNNSEAKNGINRIVDKYVDMAYRNAAQGNREKANRFVERAYSIAPDSPTVSAARKSLNKPQSTTYQPKPQKNTYPNITSAKLAYRGGKLGEKEYVRIVKKYKRIIRAEIVELKKQYAAGKISKPQYRQRARQVKLRYR